MCRLLILVFWLGAVSVRCSAEAVDSLAWARRARELIGPDLWAQVVAWERAGGARSEPESSSLLVFELAGRLWCYEPGVGTQSLSIFAGRLDEDKANLAPLLQELDPRRGAYRVIDPAWRLVASGVAEMHVPAGCFVESLARLRRMIAQQGAPEHASLLAYYAPVGDTQGGHTVLYYEKEGRRFIFDPGRPTALVRIHRQVPDDPLAIAKAAAADGSHPRPRKAKRLSLDLAALSRSEPAWVKVAAGSGAPDALEQR